MTDTEFNVETYVEQMALILDLPIDPAHKQGVIDNMTRTAAIAQLVLEFPLPSDIEVAPVFQPVFEP
ncbi:MAG TPA: DUF4089 domain-containing protein [Crinalium sp.]|jgi:hypothetical protein